MLHNALQQKHQLTSPDSYVQHDVYAFIDPGSRLQGAADGLSIVVTGASRGLGRAMALAFAKAGAACLFLTGRDKASLAESTQLVNKENSSCKVYEYLIDQSRADVEALFQQIVQDAGGRIDVLINNAGWSSPNGFQPISTGDPAEWWFTFELTIRGMYLATRAILPSMLSHGSGTIINISSLITQVSLPGSGAYAMSKMCCDRFTTFLEVDHGSQGIRAFALHPGNVKTDGSKAAAPKEFYDKFIDTPGLSGAVCVYLTTAEADYLRGRWIAANWDLEQLLQRKDEIVEKDLLKMRLAC